MLAQMFVGIDVANAPRDSALRPTGERWAVPNDETGMAALIGRLQAVQPTRIVLEATGSRSRGYDTHALFSCLLGHSYHARSTPKASQTMR
jgi:transposase